MIWHLFLVFLYSWYIECIEPADSSDQLQVTAKRILDYMDTSVSPCHNFYRFACGNFIDNAVVHDDKTQNSSFSQVDDRLDNQLKTIVYQKPPPKEPRPYHNIRHLFSLCMNEEKINARGVEHAVALMRAAGGWPVLGNWNGENWNFLDTEIQLRNLSIGGGSLFRISVGEDIKNNEDRVIEVDQAGLGLAREFLVKGVDDPIVQAYYSYMVDIAVLYGADRQVAEQKLKESLLFEIELAKLTKPREERRNFDRMYNPYELNELMKDLGWVNWQKLLQSMMPSSVPLKSNERIIVSEVQYLRDLDTFLRRYPSEVIANHMFWHSASDLVGLLTDAMRNRSLEFSRVVIGTTARKPRWKECVNVAASLGLALSSLYVKEFFDEESKKESLDMTEKIRLEIIKDIYEVDWMDNTTRERAVKKASMIVQHIGYPNELTDISKLEKHYEELRLNKEHFFESILDLSRWAENYAFRLLRQKVNQTDWRTHGAVAVVNAYYNPVENSMQFPAGILQHPFFNSKVPSYVNYARIGFVMAHEITHGFDDQGSQFDGKGELREWWEESSKIEFKKKKKCMIDQYGAYKDMQTQLLLNGVTTQGENVADNGGLKLAYRAYKRLNIKEPILPGLHNYTQDQQFFLSMANMWCTRYRPEALKYQITTGVHSPAEFRVNGVLKNFRAFTEAFSCSPNDPMNPKVKCEVW